MKTIYPLLILALSPLCLGAESFVYLSNTAKAICEDDQGYSYEERFRAIRTLDKSISAGDVDYYLNFLGRPFKKGDLREGEFNTLKNDIADKLLIQRNLPRGFTGRFLEMVDQESLGVVWRDYVLQKLPDLYQHVDTKDRARILETLWETTDTAQHTFSGTALLGLYRIRLLHSDIVANERLVERVLAVAQGSEFPEQNRITALQLLAEFEHPEALNLAREILNSESTVMLRVSAIGILGIMGQPADREKLLAFLKSPEFRLRRAAQSALRRLDG